MRVRPRRVLDRARVRLAAADASAAASSSSAGKKRLLLADVTAFHACERGTEQAESRRCRLTTRPWDGTRGVDEAALDAMTLASNRPKGDEESRDDGWIEAWLESVVSGGGGAFPNAAADPERRLGPTTRGAAVPTYFVRLVLHSPHDLQFEYESIAAKRLALECVDAETRGGLSLIHI